MLKKLVAANRQLAELKGVVTSIPNQAILISTLGLQEAKEGSAIKILSANSNSQADFAMSRLGSGGKGLLRTMMAFSRAVLPNVTVMAHN